MGILIDRDTRVLVQGITGREGGFHAAQCQKYSREFAGGGGAVVAGVTPGKGGREAVDAPVFDTVAEAADATGANASLIFVPPPFAADAIVEAVDAGVPLVVCITEGIPVRDMVYVKRHMEGSGAVLIGPNCPGVITPGACKMGIMPGHIHKAGSVGVISKSGTLTYEVVAQLTGQGLGQSTCVGIGGDPVIGAMYIDLLAMFEADPANGGHHHDRRDRRLRRAGRGALGEGERHEAARGLHRGPDGRPRAGGWATRAPSSRAARGRPPRRCG